MADDTNAPQGQPSFTIEHIYLKDCSFESPLSPGVFTSQMEPPEASVNIQTQINALEGREDAREVVLSVTVEAVSDERSIFMCEVHMAALVTLFADTEDTLNRLLGIHVPETLFPYVRQGVADLVMRGGFMPMLLQPIDFHAIYEQRSNSGEVMLDS
ncbi:MAG TPA: protein-export chaperone SecB [Gammaproteobacteria bacterium]|nr:protein-export chaperone SecB [Gammaproteobacteria bacterium]